MKRAVIYNAHWSSMGGGEKYLLLLAEVLSALPGVQILLLACGAGIDKRRLEEFSGADLSRIDSHTFDSPSDLKRITVGADLFICQSNFRWIASSAGRHVQILQVPYGQLTLSSMLSGIASFRIREGAKDFLRRRLLAHARSNADLVISNSHFAAESLLRHHNLPTRVLYPPIQDYRRAGIAKKKMILSVGRFFRGLYNDKRYDVLTRAFRESSLPRDGWEYHVAGNAGTDKAALAYLQGLKESNRTAPVVFHVNAPYEEVVRLYNEATIFWHGAGFGVDEGQHPENVEHFGMTTVEAMSAGSIPVVINKGGQREIVSPGADGYRWETVEQLIGYTTEVAAGGRRNLDLAERARERYRAFDLEHFRASAVEIFGPLLS